MKNTYCKTAFLSFFILITRLLPAQYDTIKYINGTKQAAKIIEITKKTVRFKNPKDTLGPTFSIATKYIEKFILKDGCIDLKTAGYLNCVKDPTFGVIKNENFTRNIISIDAFQLINSHFQISYEHILKNRNFGFVGYYNQGFLSGTDSSNYHRLESKISGGAFYKNNYGGFDVKYYPALHKKNTLWIALGAETGRATNILTDYHNKTIAYQYGAAYYTNESDPFYYYKSRLYVAYHFSGGFLYRINKHLILQGNICFGMTQFGTDPDPNPLIKNSPKYLYYAKLSAGLLLGYAF